MRRWVRSRAGDVDEVVRKVTEASVTVSDEAEAARAQAKRLEAAANRLIEANDDELRVNHQ